jgi:predicted AlkP superfamily pyrophosphatase or phosphodiesterase
MLPRKEYSMVRVAPTVSAILGLPAPAQATGMPIPEIVDDLAHCDRVAILAPDAFGEYAWRLWRDEMPFLKSLHARRSIVLRSVLPSITPVNFSTMIAGTDRDGHGVHTFKDDIGCETLYDVVRRAGGKSAGIGLDGYTGAELLARFADIPGNAGWGSDDVVVDKTIEIADRYRPEFLIAQIGRVDDTFHLYGPSSPQVVPMLRDTDARLRKLVERLTPLGYGVIILADHGQHDIPDAKEGEKHGGHGTDSDEDCLVPCTWVG